MYYKAEVAPDAYNSSPGAVYRRILQRRVTNNLRQFKGPMHSQSKVPSSFGLQQLVQRAP